MAGYNMWMENPDYMHNSWEGAAKCVNCGGIATPVFRPAWTDDVSGNADICINCANALADLLDRPAENPQMEKRLAQVTGEKLEVERTNAELRETVQSLREENVKLFRNQKPPAKKKAPAKKAAAKA